jgi:hypothetical protein
MINTNINKKYKHKITRMMMFNIKITGLPSHALNSAYFLVHTLIDQEKTSIYNLYW